MNKKTVQDALDGGVTGQEAAVLVAAGHVASGPADIRLEFHPLGKTEEGQRLGVLEGRVIRQVQAAVLTGKAMAQMTEEELEIVGKESRAAESVKGISNEDLAVLVRTTAGALRLAAEIECEGTGDVQ